MMLAVRSGRSGLERFNGSLYFDLLIVLGHVVSPAFDRQFKDLIEVISCLREGKNCGRLNCQDTEPISPMFPPERVNMWRISATVRLRFSVTHSMITATPLGA
jgi:hypothetical protein